MLAIDAPFPQFFDLDGRPLDAGYVYIGLENQSPQSSPKAAYWDAEMTIPAAQPLRTKNGLIARNGTPAFVFVDGNHSLLAQNSKHVQVLSARSSRQFNMAAQLRDVYASAATPTGASNVGFMPRGVGAVATDVQSALDTFQHPPTEQFYQEYGARVDRMADRVMMGGAVRHLGTNVTSQPDWLTQYQLAKGRTNGFLQSSQAGVLNDVAPDASVAFTTASQTKDLYSGYNSIGIFGLATANKVGSLGNSYAGYFEAYREVDVPGGAYGLELDVMNYSNEVNIGPYDQYGGQTIGLQIAAGGEYPSAGQFPISAAINIRKNGSTFSRGIIFGSDALTGADGVNGVAPAIVFGRGHGIYWTAAADTFTSAIRCRGGQTDLALTQEFVDNAVNLLSSTGKLVFQAAQAPGAVNYASIRGSVSGSPVQVLAQGEDANIDLQLASVGSGLIWLGGYSAGTFAQTGYMTVKDSAGNIRRLMVG